MKRTESLPVVGFVLLLAIAPPLSAQTGAPSGRATMKASVRITASIRLVIETPGARTSPSDATLPPAASLVLARSATAVSGPSPSPKVTGDAPHHLATVVEERDEPLGPDRRRRVTVTHWLAALY